MLYTLKMNLLGTFSPTHENLFPNFYIINLPSIIGIQFIDGVVENIVNLKIVWQLVNSTLNTKPES